MTARLAGHRTEQIRSGAGRDSLGLSETAHLYICPQSLFKLHPGFDQVLAGILRRDPEGEIILLEGPHRQWRQALERRFAHVMPGVAARVRFLPRLPVDAFFNLVAAITKNTTR